MARLLSLTILFDALFQAAERPFALAPLPPIAPPIPPAIVLTTTPSREMSSPFIACSATYVPPPNAALIPIDAPNPIPVEANAPEIAPAAQLTPTTFQSISPVLAYCEIADTAPLMNAPTAAPINIQKSPP